MSDRISCLMPAYNGEQFISQAIDSIINQTYKNFEIIIVDDGSTDSTPSILSRYEQQDNRIKVFTTSNRGVVAARNFGLARCSGTYIACMDCDDIATPNRFAIQLCEFRKKPNAVAVGGLVSGIDEHGTVLYPPTSFSPVSKTRLDIFPPLVANVQTSAGMFPKTALESAGGYRSTFPNAEDWDLYLRLARYGNFYNPSELVLYYREYSSSLSMKNFVLTETSGALAEIAAIAREMGLEDPGNEATALSVEEYGARFSTKICGSRTIRRYIDLRLWRRLTARNMPEAKFYRRKFFLQLLDPRSYGNKYDFSLSVRPVLSIGKKVIESIRIKN